MGFNPLIIASLVLTDELEALKIYPSLRFNPLIIASLVLTTALYDSITGATRVSIR